MGLVEATYKVVGMNCQSCAKSVESLLQEVPGIKKATVHFPTQELIVLYDPEKAPFEKLQAALTPAGYEIVQDPSTQRVIQERFLRRLRWGIMWAGFLAAWGMAIALTPSSILEQIRIPQWINWLYFLLTFLLVVQVGKIFWRPALRQLTVRHFTMDTLISLGLIGSVGLGLFELAAGKKSGHTASTAAEVLFFVLIGRYIEEKIRHQAQMSIEHLSILAAPTARLRSPSGICEVPTSQVQLNEVIEVLPGETIPLDGIIVKGTSFIEESLLTGESLPVEKGPGTQVWAGTRNLSATLFIEVKAKAHQTFLAQLITQLQQTQNSRARFQRLADKIAAFFVPIALLLSILSMLYHATTGKELLFAWERALSVLVISCPCALGLATPLAVQIAIQGALQSKILLRDIAQLENLPSATTWAFDKTGTLTEGRATVQSAQWFLPSYAGKILAVVRKSQHPLAKALAEYLEPQDQPDTLELSAYLELPGKGIIGIFGSEKIFVGNPLWILEKHPYLELPSQTATSVIAATEKEIVGIFTFHDPLKEEMKNFIDRLRQEGKHIVLLTGDPSTKGREIGERWGFSAVYEGLSPIQKADWIKTCQSKGQKVVFVGDGLNDILALQAAYVGIAVHKGVKAAVQSAGIALLQDTDTALPLLYQLSLRLRRIILQNLIWAFSYNALALPTAMGLIEGLHLSPGVSALFMSLSSLIVILNSLRVRT
ncbi:MAG: cation-translocating P-type ATPase [Bacteroidia bacterium]|nr:cation-translocating P-type ATPase [Bacteroidia bacterium]MDW8133823.1 cation-translocating P-type ATPase [Bacteroidia bacterium]